jgi:hypothetical protein
MHLRNIVNEAYALDIGRKRKAQAQQAMKDGVYVGGTPPYGYARSPDNRRELIVDTQAADIVRQIYAWAADGTSTREISRRLNIMKISSPGAHKKKSDTAGCESSISIGLWHARTVEKILENDIYSGNMVQGKTKTTYLGRQPTSPDEWIYVYNTHEAIVSPTMFKATQSLKHNAHGNSSSILATAYSPNIYKSKIFCACCGNRMERTKNNDKYIFRCIAKRAVPGSCVGNRVYEDTLKYALSEQLTTFKDELESRSKMPSKEAKLLSELQFIVVEIAEKDDVTRSLYENLVTGILDKAEYFELKEVYQLKTSKLEQRAAALQRMVNDEKRENRGVQESLRMLNMFADTLELTTEYLDRFVDRIMVLKDGRVHIDLKHRFSDAESDIWKDNKF